MPQLSPLAARFVAASLFASAVSPAAAQTIPVPAAPAAPAPASPARGAPAAPTPSAQTQSAIKLAGLVAFVANSCPKLQPNYARFSDAITALGVSKADLDKPDLKTAYIGYAARYNADAETSCERADTQFGPHGSTIEGIFAPR